MRKVKLITNRSCASESGWMRNKVERERGDIMAAIPAVRTTATRLGKVLYLDNSANDADLCLKCHSTEALEQPVDATTVRCVA